MNKKIKLVIFTLILTFSASVVFAQHCPFDGGMVVVFHLTDENGEAFTNARDIKLVQKSKKQGKNFIEKAFLPTRENLTNVYGEKNLNTYSKNVCDEDCKIFGEGMFVTHLRSDEVFYEVGKDDDSSWEKKDFEIQITHSDKQIRKIDVAKDSIYTLCYHNSKWSGFVPIEITERRNIIK